jgi:hypothetical protein
MGNYETKNDRKIESRIVKYQTKATDTQTDRFIKILIKKNSTLRLYVWCMH